MRHSHIWIWMITILSAFWLGMSDVGGRFGLVLLAVGSVGIIISAIMAIWFDRPDGAHSDRNE